MKNLLLAVVAVMAMAGCATGVEDPQPADKVATPGNPAPPETFSADLDTAKPDPLLLDNGLEAPKPDLDVPPPPSQVIDTLRQDDVLKIQAPDYSAQNDG